MLREPLDNRLLAALPGEVYGRLRPALEPVAFALGDVVYEVGGRMAYIYFPTSSVVSLIYTMEEGATAEMGLVGNEGVGSRCSWAARRRPTRRWRRSLAGRSG